MPWRKIYGRAINGLMPAHVAMPLVRPGLRRRWIWTHRSRQVHYLVRTMDVRKESRHSASSPLVKQAYPELACSALGEAIDQAKRKMLASDRAIMLQADACSRNRNQVCTKYRCWIDARGAFNEIALV